jgi:tetratricopeptide (TPR) repeat protein
VAIDLPKRVAENIGRFTGRAWLLPQILNWWDKSDDRLFLLTGGPGTGKSMVVAWLAGFGPLPSEADARVRLARLRGAAKAAYFCRSGGLNTPRLFAESVASQLANTVSGYREALKTILEDRVQIIGNVQAASAAAGSTLIGIDVKLSLGTVGDEFGFDQAFVRPLRKLYENGHTEPLLLLVDALDEAQTYTGVTLPGLLSRLDDLPPGVRILAATRDEPKVLKLFRAVKPFDLIEEADRDVDDVRTYAEGRLEGLSGVDEVKCKDFARRLATQADGVFLYAAMVLDELLERPTAELPALDIYPLPEGLSGLYHDFLNRELGKDEQRWSDRYRPLLGSIAVAYGEGLNAAQLASISKHDLDEVKDDLRRCKQYLTGELPNGPFRPFHKSFADFLLEDEDNVDYHIDAASMHRRIADHYWACNTDWSKCDDYGLLHIGEHHCRTGDLQSRRNFYDLLCPSFMRANRTRFGTYQHFQEDIALAIETSRFEKPLNIVELARASLICASLGEIAAFPPEAIGVLAYGDDENLRMALSHAACIPEVWLRHQAFRSIAESLAARDRIDEARAVLRQALDLGGSWVNEICQLGYAFFSVGDTTNALKALDQALAMARETEWWTRASRLASVSLAFAKVGEQRRALAVAEEAIRYIATSRWPDAGSLKDVAETARLFNETALLERTLSAARALVAQGQGEEALAAVCEVLAETAMLGRVVVEAKALRSPLCRARVFAALTANAAEGQVKDDTQAFAEEALKALETNSNEDDIWSLMDTLERLGKTVLTALGPTALERLVSLAKRIDPPFWRLLGLSKLAAGLKKAGHHQQADAMAHRISAFLESEFDREETIGRENVASVLAEAGFVDLALTVAKCQDVRVHVTGMSEIAGALARHGEVERALGLVNSLVDMEAPPLGHDEVVSALVEVGRVLAATGAGDRAATVFEDARRKAATLEDGLPKVRMFCEAVRFLKGRGEHDRASDAARTAMTMALDDYASKMRVSRIVIPRVKGWFEPYEAAIALALTEQWEGLEKVVETVVSTDDAWIRCQILPGVVEALVSKGERERAVELIERTRNDVESLPPWDTCFQADAMSELAITDDAVVLEWVRAVIAESGDYSLRARTLGIIAASFVRIGDRPQSTDTLEEALKAAGGIGDPAKRAEVVTAMAQDVAASGSITLARQAIDRMGSNTDKDRALCNVAVRLAEVGSYEEAMAVQGSVRDHWTKEVCAVDQLLVPLLQARQYDKALVLAESCRAVGLKALGQSSVAMAMARVVPGPHVTELASRALNLAELAADSAPRSFVCAKVAVVAAAMQQPERVQSLANGVLEYLEQGGRSDEHVALLSWVGEAFARSGSFERAAVMAERAVAAWHAISDEHQRADELRWIVEFSSETGMLDLQRLASLASSLQEPWARRIALAHIAAHRRVSDWAPLLSVLRMIENDFARGDALGDVAEAMAEVGAVGALDQALDLAMGIESEFAKLPALGRVARAMIRAGYEEGWSHALTQMGRFLSSWEQAQGLSIVARALSAAGRPKEAAGLARRAFDIAKLSRDSDVQDKVAYFCSLGRAWHGLGRSKDARELVDMAVGALESLGGRTFGSKIGYTYAAYVLFELLGEVGTCDQLDRALAVAITVDDPGERAINIVHAASACVQTGEYGRALAAAERSTDATRDAEYQRPIVLAKAARVMTACGEQLRAIATLANAFAEARTAGRRHFYEALEGGATTLAAIDQGDALWRIYEATIQVEGWWSSSSSARPDDVDE